MSSDDWRPSCYDCRREMPREYLNPTTVMDTSGPGIGYDEIVVPLCSHCRGKRHGFDCPQCGITHETKDDAEYCCRRRRGEAPDCPECGRRMERTAHGAEADGTPTVEFAECEACSVSWGRFTGWHFEDRRDSANSRNTGGCDER